MAHSNIYMVVILAAFFAANMPWLSERFLMVFNLAKNAWLRWLEWLILYFITGLLSYAVEFKLTGTLYKQGWEFYVVTLCLFIVFALPGFIYHHDFKRLLRGKSSV